MILIEWYVYYHDSNRDRIDAFDIFSHGNFRKEFNELIKCDLTKEKFAEKLKHILLYYFWGKCEWEIVIKSLVSDDLVELKTDVFLQIMLNWSPFVDYCWSFRKEK